MVELYNDAGLANETLALMAVAAKRAGLSASDLNTMMAHLSDSLIQVEAIYGTGAGKRYADALIGISAAAKEAGADLGVLAGIMKKLAEQPLDFVALLGADAITGEPAANIELMVGKVGDLREQMKGMDRPSRASSYKLMASVRQNSVILSDWLTALVATRMHCMLIWRK